MKSYTQTCNEVYEVLKLAPKEQLDLIPKEVIDGIEANAQKSNEKVNLDFDMMGNVILSNEAKSMIVAIYGKYFLDENGKKFLTNQLRENDRIEEDKKAKNYQNFNDPFYNSKKENTNIKSDNIANNTLVVEEIKCESMQLINTDEKSNIFEKIKQILKKIKNKILKI